MTFDITRKGNAVGFTARGETICGKFLSKARCWRISVVGISGAELMTDDRNRNFADKRTAIEYAASLIDAKQTELLAWW